MKISQTLKNSLICITLAIASCSTGRIGISILEPAKFSIPLSIDKVTLFPGSGLPDPPGIVDTINHAGLEPGYNYNRIKRGYMEGLYTTMAASPRFLKVVPADTTYEDLVRSGSLNLNDLRRICNHDTTDAILILRNAVSRDTLVRYGYPGLYCGIVYRVINHTKWSFFQPFLHNGYFDMVFTDTSIFDQADESCDPHFALQNSGAVLYDAFYHTGAKMGEQISPTWHNDVERIIFAGPGNQLRKAYLFVLNDQWDKAADIWNTMALSRNRRHASQASYNIALAWEQGDDLDQAMLWITHADSLFSSGRTLMYKKILEARLKKRALLDEQMIPN